MNWGDGMMDVFSKNGYNGEDGTIYDHAYGLFLDAKEYGAFLAAFCRIHHKTEEYAEKELNFQQLSKLSEGSGIPFGAFSGRNYCVSSERYDYLRILHAGCDYEVLYDRRDNDPITGLFFTSKRQGDEFPYKDKAEMVQEFRTFLNCYLPDGFEYDRHIVQIEWGWDS